MMLEMKMAVTCGSQGRAGQTRSEGKARKKKINTQLPVCAQEHAENVDPATLIASREPPKEEDTMEDKMCFQLWPQHPGTQRKEKKR